MSPKLSILFVDDEPRILTGLRRMLHSMRNEFDMSLAPGGLEALQILDSQTFDLILSDMRMPGMDGVALLGEVRQRHPHMIRIALSGQASKETVLTSVGLAHQYLAKPCDADGLKATLLRLSDLQNLVESTELRKIIAALPTVPALPSNYEKLKAESESDDPSITTMAEIVQSDPGLAARVTQLVSTAFFARPHPAPSPYDGTVFLGMDVLKAIVTDASAFTPFDDEAVLQLPLQVISGHSLHVALCAKAIAQAENVETDLVSHAFTAGLLHDIGKFVFASQFTSKYQSLLTSSFEAGAIVTDRNELDAFGATHWQVGAFLLSLWGLPEPIIKAVELHHTPKTSDCCQFSPLTAVHVADAIVNEIDSTNTSSVTVGLDMAYLDRSGLADKTGLWGEIAREALDKESKSV